MPSFNSRTFIIPALIFFIYDFGITDIFSISANLFTVVTKGITTTESLDRPESLLGTITFGSGQEEVFLGRDWTQTRNYSEETSAKIDEEVKKIIDNGYNKAKEILTMHSDKLHTVANLLLEKEKVDGEEFAAIFTD